uniref:Uncharacterized protein n=1 Tax=Meloidogyne javanica TaxID=6303 RepID=A0A915MBU3_MELJA
MCGCRTPSDFICDLPMEINFAFYPPPTINLPNLEIPDLKEYKYKFDRERLTIEKYEQEQQIHLESHSITSKPVKESSCESNEEQQQPVLLQPQRPNDEKLVL